ncbi:hypothetical protein ACWDWU_01915 [Streptomyces sp. NPDC003442]
MRVETREDVLLPGLNLEVRQLVACGGNMVVDAATCGLPAARFCPTSRTFYDRKRNEGKSDRESVTPVSGSGRLVIAPGGCAFVGADDGEEARAKDAAARGSMSCLPKSINAPTVPGRWG